MDELILATVQNESAIQAPDVWAVSIQSVSRSSTVSADRTAKHWELVQPRPERWQEREVQLREGCFGSRERMKSVFWAKCSRVIPITRVMWKNNNKSYLQERPWELQVSSPEHLSRKEHESVSRPLHPNGPAGPRRASSPALFLSDNARASALTGQIYIAHTHTHTHTLQIYIKCNKEGRLFGSDLLSIKAGRSSRNTPRKLCIYKTHIKHIQSAHCKKCKHIFFKWKKIFSSETLSRFTQTSLVDF